jgi:DNA-binding GntR family transcriptional regulator
MDQSTNTPRLSGLQNRSLREQVLDVLRESILDGEFRPGQPLIETDLAAQLQISRAPLREAMRVLSAEGLLETVPYRGTTVKALTKTDIEELYSLRGALESFAIQRIIARENPDDVELLKSIYANMLDAAEKGDLKRLNSEDQVFHATLMELSAHSLLQSIWNMVSMRVRQVMALRNKQNNNITQVAYNHLPIIEAMAAGDGERATRLIQEHVASAGDIIIDEWEYVEDSP